jgi:hypothetical protein
VPALLRRRAPAGLGRLSAPASEFLPFRASRGSTGVESPAHPHQIRCAHSRCRQDAAPFFGTLRVPRRTNGSHPVPTTQKADPSGRPSCVDGWGTRITRRHAPRPSGAGAAKTRHRSSARCACLVEPTVLILSPQRKRPTLRAGLPALMAGGLGLLGAMRLAPPGPVPPRRGTVLRHAARASSNQRFSSCPHNAKGRPFGPAFLR